MSQSQAQTPKAVPTIEATIEGSVLMLTFSHGESLTLDSTTLSVEITAQARMHGLKQKLVDAAAIARNTTTGKSATVEDKFLAVREVYDRLLAGHWNKPKGEPGAGKGKREREVLIMAVARLRGVAVGETRAWIEERSDAERTALAANPRVAALMAEIRAEQTRVDPSIDSEGLLNSLF